MRGSYRYSLIGLVMLWITACGAYTSEAIRLPTPSAPSHVSQPLPTVAALQTLVPVTQQIVTIGDAHWRIAQPQGVTPIVHANSKGILWVQFPPLETNAAIDGYGLRPIPHGAYTVMYTPLRTDGGTLAQGAQQLLLLASRIAQDDVTVTGITSAGSDHFFVSTYELLHGAQSGGTTRIRWIAPATHTVREVVAAKEGGGSFLTTASNDRWLFWNSYRLGENAQYDPHAQAGLVDVQSGQNEPVMLDGLNIAVSATWQADGTLLYVSGDDSKTRVFDPATKQLRP